MDIEKLDDKISQDMRNFVTKDITPQRLYLYIRFYPYPNFFVNLRTAIISKISNEGLPSTSGLISLMYFFPMAFILSTEEEKNCGINIMGLAQNDDLSDLYLSKTTVFFDCTTELIPSEWPATVDNNRVMMTDTLYTTSLGIKMRKM